MANTYSMPLGHTIGFVHKHPERTASRQGPRWDSDIQFRVWPNRAALAKYLRWQENFPHEPDFWRPVVALGTTEGY
jgi:hypothetical protein